MGEHENHENAICGNDSLFYKIRVVVINVKRNCQIILFVSPSGECVYAIRITTLCNAGYQQETPCLALLPIASIFRKRRHRFPLRFGKHDAVTSNSENLYIAVAGIVSSAALCCTLRFAVFTGASQLPCPAKKCNYSGVSAAHSHFVAKAYDVIIHGVFWWAMPTLQAAICCFVGGHRPPI